MKMSVIYIKGCHILWYNGSQNTSLHISDFALKTVYVGDDIVHLCETRVRYSSAHLMWVEEFKEEVFWKKKKTTVVLFCEFIIPDVAHIASSMKIDLFLWDSTLSNCHRDSVIVQSARPTRGRNHAFRSLSAVCQDAVLTMCCLNCSKLSEGKEVVWSQQ